MKLKNKLIPMMTIAGLASTIAPASLTSCSSIQMTSLVNGYTPTVKRAVWDGQQSDKTKMLDFYASSCNENMEVFKQDLWWTKAGQYLYAFDSMKSLTGIRIESEALKSSVNNLEVNKRICQIEEAGQMKEVSYYTANFDYVLNIVYKTYGGYMIIRNGAVVTGAGDAAHSEKLTLHLKNIPFTINKEGTTAKTLDATSILFNGCFAARTLMTDWVLQFDLNIGGTSEVPTIDHSAFTNLQANGFDFSFKIENSIVDTVIPTSTGNPERYTSDFAYDFNKDSLFDQVLQIVMKDPINALTYPEVFTFYTMYSYYVASHFLSDIVDVNNQIWGN